MKYISNAKYGEPVETGTIYRSDNKRLDICVHTLCGCGETLYMNCRALGIVDRKLNNSSANSSSDIFLILSALVCLLSHLQQGSLSLELLLCWQLQEIFSSLSSNTFKNISAISFSYLPHIPLQSISAITLEKKSLNLSAI